MKLLNIDKFLDKIWDEKGSEAYADFNEALADAWMVNDDGEAFFVMLEENGIQIWRDEKEEKFEERLQQWLWDGENAGWFD